MQNQDTILTLNAGSSSLKFALYSLDLARPDVRLAYHGQIRDLDSAAHFTVHDDGGTVRLETALAVDNHEQAVDYLLDWIDRNLQTVRIVAAGHRVVHGGRHFDQAVRIDQAVLDQLRELVSLAPLHMPHNLAAIEALYQRHHELTQVACFDTAFHRSMPRREQRYALPREWFDRGVRRYGFHGLSYEYIASVLPQHLGAAADGRIVVAHLGHGASLCAMQQRRSIATTMGFTPLDGIPMATRPGALDPGIVTWLLREAGLAVEQVDELLNHRSGLLGLSAYSGDMRELLADPRPEAAEAVDYFVHHTQRAIASLAGALGGLDALVFTAGIGEHAPAVRERICRAAAWLGIEFDPDANAANRSCLSRPASAVSVWRIPTDEEWIIARHTLDLLDQPGRETTP